jgi:hypothetical protein
MQVDHAVIQVAELDAARIRYEELGFTVTPRGMHSAQLGSGNHCILFARAYIELYGILQPTDFNLRFRKALQEQGEHVSAIAFGTASAQATCDELRSRGIAAEAPVAFSRPLETQDGRMAEASFRVTLFNAEGTGVQLFACEHLTPDVVRQPLWLEHANTAEAIEECVIACGDPRATEAAWRRVTGEADEGTRLRFTRWADAAVQPTAGAIARVAELVLRVGDADAARGCLERNRVDFMREAGSLVVGADEACGVRLRFRSA